MFAPVVPVHVHIHIHIHIHQIILFEDLTYSLQWTDERLFTSPCMGALEALISLDFEQGTSDIAREKVREQRSRYWVPSITVCMTCLLCLDAGASYNIRCHDMPWQSNGHDSQAYTAIT